MADIRKFRQKVEESADPRQRVCSRLLKVYSDVRALSERTFEEDMETVQAKIDATLPLGEAKKDIGANKKAQIKNKKKGNKAAGASSGVYTTSTTIK